MIAFNNPSNMGTRQTPAVSVVMAVYNAQDFLAEAIESVLEQTLGNFELLVIDDASTDGSPAIIERYARADRRIRAFRLARNGGTAHARNVALEHAQAPFVAICDDDDRQVPERLASQVAYLEAHPQHVMVGCRIRPSVTWKLHDWRGCPEATRWRGRTCCSRRSTSILRTCSVATW